MPVKQSGLGSWHPTPHTPVVFCILVNPSGAAGGHHSEGLDGCWSPRVAGLVVAPVGCFFVQAAPCCLTPPSKAAPRIRATFPCAASQPPPGLRRVCWSLRQPKSCAVLGGCSPRPLGAVGSSSTPSTVGIGNQKGWSVRRVKYSYCFSSCACVAAEVESGQV